LCSNLKLARLLGSFSFNFHFRLDVSSWRKEQIVFPASHSFPFANYISLYFVRVVYFLLASASFFLASFSLVAKDASL
jgi:hypothetical protein